MRIIMKSWGLLSWGKECEMVLCGEKCDVEVWNIKKLFATNVMRGLRYGNFELPVSTIFVYVLL